MENELIAHLKETARAMNQALVEQLPPPEDDIEEGRFPLVDEDEDTPRGTYQDEYDTQQERF